MKECREIRELLSVILDGMATSADQKRVDAHMVVCQHCRTALIEMKRTVQLVRQTGEVEPPPWLTTRIMARISEEATPRRSFWQRLFLPLPVKVPLQALALLFICVTGYYVAKMSRTDVELLQTLPEDRQKSIPQAALPQAVPARPGPSRQTETTTKATEALQPAAPSVSSPAPAAAPPRGAEPLPSLNLTPSPLHPAAPPRTFAHPPTLESIPAPAAKSFPKTPADALAPLLERSQNQPHKSLKKSQEKDEAGNGISEVEAAEYSVRLDANKPTMAGKSIDELVHLLEGIVTARRDDPSGHLLSVRIASRRLPDLLAGLSRLGTLRDSSPLPVDHGRELTVTITW